MTKKPSKADLMVYVPRMSSVYPPPSTPPPITITNLSDSAMVVVVVDVVVVVVNGPPPSRMHAGSPLMQSGGQFNSFVEISTDFQLSFIVVWDTL